MINDIKNKGFTLLEIAIVLLIVSILLGYTVAMAPRQQELKQFKKAKAELSEIQGALYAFAQVNGYLPCPAEYTVATNTSASDGFECRDINNVTALCEDGINIANPAVDSCDVWFGAVPGKTLGINGAYSAAGLLLDPWGEPYRYQVTDSDDEDTNDDGDPNGNGDADFVLLGALKNTLYSTAPNTSMDLSLLRPNLAICTADPSALSEGSETSCGSADKIIENAPVVISSLGKNRNQNVVETSWIERENLDNSSADTVFVSTSFSDDFDDLVKWISPNILYSKMIEAGQLP